MVALDKEPILDFTFMRLAPDFELPSPILFISAPFPAIDTSATFAVFLGISMFSSVVGALRSRC